MTTTPSTGQGHMLAYVLHASGATVRQIQHWTARGWLHAHNHQNGSGYWRTWTDREVTVAYLMRLLVNHGIAAPEAATYARDMADNLAAGHRPRLELGPHLVLELVTTQPGGAS